MAPPLTEARIGIALAAYKPKLPYLVEQLQSIQDQSFKAWKCIIQFDSEMPDLGLSEFVPFVGDPRFVFIENEKNLGHKKNFQTAAFELLKRFPELHYISFCDQDDIWYPQKLERSLREIAHLPPFSSVFTDMDLLLKKGSSFAPLQNAQGKNITGWTYEGLQVDEGGVNRLIARNFVAGTAMLLDRKVIDQYGEIPESFEFHDHWYAVVSAVKGRLQAIHEPMYLYRQHGENVVGATQRVGLLELRKPKGLKEVLYTCFERFMICQKRAQVIVEKFPENDQGILKTYQSRADCGLRLFFFFLGSLLKGDIRTSRPMLAVFLGKLIWILNLSHKLSERKL